MDMLTRMQTGRFKVFKHLHDWWEEFRLYHRKDGKVVKENDDLMAATRYALMMLRFARTAEAYDRFPPAHRISELWHCVIARAGRPIALDGFKSRSSAHSLHRTASRSASPTYCHAVTHELRSSSAWHRTNVHRAAVKVAIAIAKDRKGVKWGPRVSGG